MKNKFFTSAPCCVFLLFAVAALPLFSAAPDSTAEIKNKVFSTTRINSELKIDGLLNEEAWKGLTAASDFIQADPLEGKPASQKTEAYIVYDNTSLYIGAMLYDTAPDSILKQLGNRDEWVSADNFRVVFDTYDTQQDAFDFSVSASGVQRDSRFSDENYDAVWESAVKILPNGWSVELRIPYSALRFPVKEEQAWGLQITRIIQRKNEFIQWALTPKKGANSMLYWGKLQGLKNISPPLRLSLTPYISLQAQRSPDLSSPTGLQHTNSISYGGGADIKYGINESFTLDATLLPDFSQVQSDNIQKNLKAFEIEYEEQRPFFKEGVELFSRGNLFYSRRIGKTPTGFYSAADGLDSNEVLEKNPNQSKLLNSTKISGRTKNGLGIGILNAVVDNTYATSKNNLTGEKKEILTEPFTNYNILVFDQQLKNSSSLYFMNTSVIRFKPTAKNSVDILGNDAYNDANVNGAGFSMNNRKNTFRVNADGALSNKIARQSGSETGTYTSILGYGYGFGLSKNGGKFRYGFNHRTLNKDFDINDLGINFETNYSANSVWLNFWQYQPFWRFLNTSVNVSIDHSIYLPEAENGYLKRKNWKELGMGLNMNGVFTNFTWAYIGFRGSPYYRKDYYEAREPGNVFIRYPFLMAMMEMGTNESKKFSISGNIRIGSTEKIDEIVGYDQWFEISVNPKLRVNDRFSLELESEYNPEKHDRGWVSTDTSGTAYFGLRNVTVLTNSIYAKYLFMNNLSLSLNGRHYWSRGDYVSFFELQDDGFLMHTIGYEGNHDFNFNAFTIDMVFEWQFAPGSVMNVVWKNSIYNEDAYVINNFSDNFNNTLRSPQTNTISIKVLYYLDYLYLSKLKKSRN